MLKKLWLYYTQIRHIKGHFDPVWYAKKYDITNNKKRSALEYFCQKGWKNGDDPSPYFSTSDYLLTYPDVVQSGQNPIIHYARYGEKEGRSPCSDLAICSALYQASERHQFASENITPWLTLIVPVSNASTRHLDEFYHSYTSQNNSGIHLIFTGAGSSEKPTCEWLKFIAEKPNVRVLWSMTSHLLESYNQALPYVSTQWVSFLQPDGLIAPFGLDVIYQAILAAPEAKLFYTDEAYVDAQLEIQNAALKPAYDPILLSGFNYINNFAVYLVERVIDIEGFKLHLNSNHNYDFLLYYCKHINENDVIHVPYPAYWQREKTDSKTQESLRHQDDIKPTPINDGHHISFQSLQKDEQIWPVISIIIPNKNAPELLQQLLTGLFEKTDYPAFEVIIIDNGSDDLKTLNIYQSYKNTHKNISIHIKPEPFNFARMINRGFKIATGEHYLLLNNDIEIIQADWLKEMVSCLEYKHVGIVGTKLLYPDRTIQHAGVIVGYGGLAGHWYGGTPENFGGPFNRLHYRNSMTAVTAAAMLISGDCQSHVGEFDDQNFSVAYNDVDYCLRAHKNKYRIIWTPHAPLIHHESATRGSDTSKENLMRFNREKENLKQIHKTTSFSDPTASLYFIQGQQKAQTIFTKPHKFIRRWFE